MTEDVTTLTVSRTGRPPAVVLYTSRSRRPITIAIADAERLIRLLQNAVAGKPGHHGKTPITYGEPIDL